MVCPFYRWVRKHWFDSSSMRSVLNTETDVDRRGPTTENSVAGSGRLGPRCQNARPGGRGPNLSSRTAPFSAGSNNSPEKGESQPNGGHRRAVVRTTAPGKTAGFSPYCSPKHYVTTRAQPPRHMEKPAIYDHLAVSSRIATTFLILPTIPKPAKLTPLVRGRASSGFSTTARAMTRLCALWASGGHAPLRQCHSPCPLLAQSGPPVIMTAAASAGSQTDRKSPAAPATRECRQ